MSLIQLACSTNVGKGEQHKASPERTGKRTETVSLIHHEHMITKVCGGPAHCVRIQVLTRQKIYFTTNKNPRHPLGKLAESKQLIFWV